VSNQKGGVGKTTTVINLGAALCRQGRRVLLVDIDPQGNATSGLGVDKSGLGRCVYDVLLERCPLDEVIVPGGAEGLNLVPATLRLAGAEVELVSALGREKRLAGPLAQVAGRYDHVLIDCPPSLGLLTLNALAAADGVLVPIQCEFYALEGLGQLLQVVDMVRRHVNGRLQVEGVLLTMYDARLNLCDQVADEVRRHFGPLTYATVIPRNVRLAEAPSFGIPALRHDGRSRGAMAYLELAAEVLEREKAGFGTRTVGAPSGG
jgi:chromosome partitioning protein